MKLWETFRFEVAYQSRRVSTWFYFVLIFVISFLMARVVFVAEAREGSYFLNAPFAVAQVTIVACMLSLLALAAVAGGAAALGRRGVTSYLGGAFVFFTAVVSWQLVAATLGYWGLAKLTDPLGLTLIGELSKVWTPVEKNSLVVGPQMSILSNRFVWVGVALGIHVLTYFRFRFTHVAGDDRRRRRADARLSTTDAATNVEPASDSRATATARMAPVTVPHVRRTFGLSTRARQTLAVALESFRVIVKGWGGPALVVLAVLLLLTGPFYFQDEGFPQFPTTGQFVGVLESANEHGMWLIVPLLIVYYAGELVWREREAGLGEIAGAAPVPVWVSFAGKFVGIALWLILAQVVVTAAAMTVQASMGYYEFELGLYARILFGIRLTDYLLFALLALVIQVLVRQKYVGHLLAVIAYVLVAFGPELGIEPGLFVYGSDPGWTYSDMRGLEPFIWPWLLFKLYWAAWALLLAVAAKLHWPRGTEHGFGPRLRMARRRFSRRSAATFAAAAALALTFGGLIFYNTRVLYASHAPPSGQEWRAEYERR